MSDRDDRIGAGTGLTADEGRRERRAERRRRVRERRFDTTVPSPCISVCQLDPGTDLCIGCHRHVDEIRDWPIMTAEEKRDTLDRVAARGPAKDTPPPDT